MSDEAKANQKTRRDLRRTDADGIAIENAILFKIAGRGIQPDSASPAIPKS